MTNKLETLVDPKGHHIPLSREYFGKEQLDDLDCNGTPMTEDGLYCFTCDNVYGLSKLEEPKFDYNKK